MKNILFPLFAFVLLSCQSSRTIAVDKGNAAVVTKVAAPSDQAVIAVMSKQLPDLTIEDTTFVNIKEYSANFVFDMKYATTDNFLKAKVYDCAECYLRLKTVKALIKADSVFLSQGFRIKLLDCYRPVTIQKRMWAIVNNPSYVADPAKGSIHNRGGAVDITLVDSNGKEVDMGTAFDFFGKKAGHSYNRLSKEVLANRQYLKKVMIESGFQPLDSEWWHYNLNGAAKDKVSDFKWECE